MDSRKTLEKTRRDVYLRRHVTKISKNEGSLYIKTTGYYILCIFACQSLTLFHRETLPHTLLIICQLNYKWHLKYILQISTNNDERITLARFVHQTLVKAVCTGYDRLDKRRIGVRTCSELVWLYVRKYQ